MWHRNLPGASWYDQAVELFTEEVQLMRKFTMLSVGPLLCAICLFGWLLVPRGAPEFARPAFADEPPGAAVADEDIVHEVHPFWGKGEIVYRVTARQLKEQYPFESLRDRLAYEANRTQAADFRPAASVPERIRRRHPESRSLRAHALLTLHREKAEEFFRVPDQNGLVRTPSASAATWFFRQPRGPIAADLPVMKSPRSEADKLVYEEPPIEEPPPIDTASLP